MVFLAEIEGHIGERAQAVDYLSQALRGYQKLGNDAMLVWALEVFAALAESWSRLELSVLLLAAARAQHRRLGLQLEPTRKDDFEGVVASVREQLGGQVFEELWAEGEALSLREVVAYALEASR